MNNFEIAKELFKDTIDLGFYFDSASAEIAKNKIQDSIADHTMPLVFLIGDSGVGKSYILQCTYLSLLELQTHSILFVENPFFAKSDVLKVLYNSGDFLLGRNVNLDTMKNKILNHDTSTQYTVLVDQADLLTEEQFNFMSRLNSSNLFQFVLSLQKEESAVVLKNKYFKSKNSVVIEHGNIECHELERYIQNIFAANALSEIAVMFSKEHVKKINHLSQGNFRTIKKLLYTLMKLLAYAQRCEKAKYHKVSNCLLTMAALEIGLMHDA